MPEAVTSFAHEIQKKKPTQVFSNGLGDSDFFPAFEDDSGGSYSTPDDEKWGFRITGGADFKMPITVFQVTENGLAEEKGIRLGDIILQINGIDVTNLSLGEVHKIIETANYTLELITANMDDDENVNINRTKKVALRLKTPEKPLVDHHKVESSKKSFERKVWHPVVWQQPPPPQYQEIVPGQEPPHHRIIRNIRRFFKETEETPETRQKYIENMLLALPTASKSG